MSDDTPGRGRPSLFTKELADEICRRLAAGETLRAICRDEHMPDERTVRRWSQDDEAFSPQYTQAREVGYLSMADELVEIADDGTNDFVEKERADGSKHIAFDAEHVQRSKLRVDTRKWLLSKALPKIYGEKVTADVSAKVTTESPDPLELMRIIAFAFAEAREATPAQPEPLH